MQTFQWNSDFETGLDTVDRQHHRLVDLINAFSDCLSEDAVSAQTVDRVLGELADYAVYHFTEEESMMRELGVDRRHVAVHEREHAHFIDEVSARRRELSLGGSEGAAPLLDFLIYWLIYHILGSDQNMARQIDAIGRGATPAAAFEGEERERSRSTDTLLSALNGLFHLVSLRNRELRQLNETLEVRVADRTRELAEANRVLSAMAMTDELTGLPNRRHVMTRLELAVLDYLGGEQPVSCLMIDADGFKRVNDTFGHDGGDRLLEALARTLRQSVRTDDVVGRLGGDEFLVILPKTPHQGAMVIADRVLEGVRALTVDVGGGEWRGSVSIGVATAGGGMRETADLVKAADESLYLAKSAGRDCVRSVDGE